MLGDELGTITGRVMGQRVLPSNGAGMRVESSLEADGQLLEIPVHLLATYEAVVRPDGTFIGEGQGVVMSQQGAHASFSAQGIGRFTEDGGISFRGSSYYETESERLAPLAAVAIVYEYEVDADGSAKSTIWEWK